MGLARIVQIKDSWGWWKWWWLGHYRRDRDGSMSRLLPPLACGPFWIGRREARKGEERYFNNGVDRNKGVVCFEAMEVGGN